MWKERLGIMLGRLRDRRLWGRLSGAALLAALAAIAAWLWLESPRMLPLQRIELSGELRYLDAAQLRAAIAPLARDGFLRVDVSAVREALEALPWVYRAGVRRVWPDILAIEIEEQRPLAVWDKGGLVNVHGEIFVPRESAMQTNLPVFSGVAGLSAVMAARYGEIRQQLAPLETGIARLELNSRRAWALILDNGIRLELGRNIGTVQLGRLARVYPKVLAPEAARIARIDLRYTNGFAVQWQEPPAVTETAPAPGAETKSEVRIDNR